MRGRSRGFTLIELIAVIILVGILGAAIHARFAGGSTYESAIVRDQIITSARSAQQKALGHRDVRLSLQPQDNVLLLSVTDAQGPLQTVDVPLRGIILSARVDASDDCSVPGTPITESAPLVLDYVLPGNLDKAGGVPVASQVHICVGEDPGVSLCIASTGFAFAGTCEP